jgi:hypothetical protein
VIVGTVIGLFVFLIICGIIKNADPDDYAWETYSQNHMRKTPEARHTEPERATALVEWAKDPKNLEAKIRNGRKGACRTWRIGRNLPCNCGQHSASEMV